MSNRIRYYGWAMAEMASQAYELGINVSYEFMPIISGTSLTVTFWCGRKIEHFFVANLSDDESLNRLEANVEAVMVLKESGVEI